MTRFALYGAAGYIAPRHLKAIAGVGGDLVAACDPHDSVGILDQHFPDCHFFTSPERFDRHLDDRKRAGEPVEVVSVCSPNYLHDVHTRMALSHGAHVICEKPLVINPRGLDRLREAQESSTGNIYTVLQLRLLPSLIELREKVATGGPYTVSLRYVTRRGRWYRYSWKGTEEKSGGILPNIGIHFFDLLIWLFGPTIEPPRLYSSHGDFAEGFTVHERARVAWSLSLREDDLPEEARAQGHTSWRMLEIDGERIEFSPGFTALHTEVYRRVLIGEGFTIEDAAPSIELVHQLRELR
jgi:UDP-N-acetyl-2-amino-2-deoxyglucuronate dehydrogenase